MPYNSNTNRKNVSTNIKTFYGDTASMGMTYWNDMISIRLNPCSGTNEDGIRQYDRNRSFSTAITAQKALGLTQLIDEHIVPVIKKVEAGEDLEKPVNVAMKMGNKNAIIVIQYAKDDKGVPTLYFIGYVSAIRITLVILRTVTSTSSTRPRLFWITIPTPAMAL